MPRHNPAHGAAIVWLCRAFYAMPARTRLTPLARGVAKERIAITFYDAERLDQFVPVGRVVLVRPKP